jgi:hypothetical protein
MDKTDGAVWALTEGAESYGIAAINKEIDCRTAQSEMMQSLSPR